MKSESQVHRDLDTMRAILAPLDDDGREGLLATILLWFLTRHEDRETALDHLIVRMDEIESDLEREARQ
jgi:hypothetical protein